VGGEVLRPVVEVGAKCVVGIVDVADANVMVVRAQDVIPMSAASHPCSHDFLRRGVACCYVLPGDPDRSIPCPEHVQV
jgi:hypothetical protein